MPVPVRITQANPAPGSVRYSNDPTLITGRLQGDKGGHRGGDSRADCRQARRLFSLGISPEPGHPALGWAGHWVRIATRMIEQGAGRTRRPAPWDSSSRISRARSRQLGWRRLRPLLIHDDSRRIGLSCRRLDNDVGHVRPRILGLVPGAAAIVIGIGAVIVVRASRRQMVIHRADDGGGGRSDGEAGAREPVVAPIPVVVPIIVPIAVLPGILERPCARAGSNGPGRARRSRRGL